MYTDIKNKYLKKERKILMIELLSNKILITGICAWAVAQVLKMILHTITTRTLDWHRLIGDGGMPSCHSSTVTATALMTGFQNGFDSPIFVIATILAVIVMHDAMGVRLETGKQAKRLNEMAELFAHLGEPSLSFDTKLKEFVGHTPMQVAAGFLLGIIVACISNFKGW